MKIKKFIAGIVACGAALMMTVAAQAAQEVKVSGAYIDEYGATVPVVFHTTEDEDLGNVDAWELVLYYDPAVWTYDGYNDPNVYTYRGTSTPLGNVVTNPDWNTDGSCEIVYYCGGGNGFPTVTDGEVSLVEVYFVPVDSSTTTISDSDFTVGVKYVSYDDGTGSGASVKQMGTDMRSFFTFDVTGDLGGNEIVGLYASTDAGVTMQELTKYVSTTLEEGSEDYESATTKFLVAVNNTQGADGVINITIYGEKRDGTKIALADYHQYNFQTQTFAITSGQWAE